MKRFFPSSVMLTPFVVKYYSDDERDDDELDPVEDVEQLPTSDE
ncbi:MULTISPECIES: hypothetical protein [Vibrio]